MTLIEFIKNKILRRNGVERLDANPNSERYTFISDAEGIKKEEIQACKTWFLGSGDELLNFYTEKQAKGFAKNPIYNRNKRNYFWSLSAIECKIKRVHSGIPNMIITTLTNAIGMPDIKCEGWDEIALENDFKHKLTQQARPLTLAAGFGAWKVNIIPNLSKYPLWEYYDGEYVKYAYTAGILTGIIFQTFYKKENKDYVLIETRSKSNGNSYITYELFKLEKGDEVSPVELDTIPELAKLEDIVIPNYDEILAVPARYFYDPLNPKYGRSIYAGKLDLFDMLDEIWSQASQTNRVSTPVEYYSPDALDRSVNGSLGTPNLYNRQFVQKSGVPDGDGNMSDDIITTQPDLNFDKYGGLAKDVLDYILTGVLSPASLGIDLSRKDNAEAQREKEKITIMNRDNIIDAETIMLNKIVKISLDIKQYIDSEVIEKRDYDISIKYCEFANPSFENQLQVLGSAWANGELSTEKYVDLLWLDKMSDEEKKKEIAWLDEHQKELNLNESMVPDLPEDGEYTEGTEENQEQQFGGNL